MVAKLFHHISVMMQMVIDPTVRTVPAPTHTQRF